MFKEIITTILAVLGVLLLIGATGAVETDQWLLAVAYFIMGVSSMFISIVTQNSEDSKEEFEPIHPSLYDVNDEDKD